nr:MAG: capsid protein [Cressdnaviricota sp.]
MRYGKRRVYKKRSYRRKSTRYPSKTRGYRSRSRAIRKSRPNFNRVTPEETHIANVKRGNYGPYRSRGYQPILRGTPHRSESQITWAAIFASALNPAVFAINAFGYQGKLRSGNMTTAAPLSGFDAYLTDSTDDNYPQYITKAYSKACSIRLNCSNVLQAAVNVRVTFCKNRNYMSGSLPGQWNSDITRPVNTRHWKIVKTHSFIMTPATYAAVSTDLIPAGPTTVVYKYYFTFNKWRKTKDGDPANSYDQWSMENVAPFETIYMFIDTDAVPGAGNTFFQMNVIDYFSTVEDTQT